MRIFFLCFGLFLVAFMIHIAWWRIKTPTIQRKVLLAIFGGVFCVFLAISGTAGISMPELVTVTLFYIPSTFAYIAFHTAIEADSPSMVIATKIAETKGVGLTKAELDSIFADASPVEQRIEAMLLEGMVTQHGSKLQLTGKGRALARLLRIVAKVAGIRLGG
jgi:hypothetical protein